MSTQGDSQTSGYTVTVLGLGAMGLPMATRLAGRLTVHGFDIVENRLKLAADAGVVRFDSARAAAIGADAVLLAVRNSEQLGDVLFGANGVGGGPGEGLCGILARRGGGGGDPGDGR